MNFVTVGTNFVTDRFICEAKANEDFNLYGIHSRSKERAEEYARTNGAEHFFTSLENVADDRNVQAVYIASPTSCHAAMSEMFLRAGKAVLCEKPICSNAREFRHVVQVAKETGNLYMEAYMTPFLPNFQAVTGAVGKIGKIRRAEFLFEKYSSRYDAFLRGERPNTFLPEYSNGAAMDLGVYCLYSAVFLFGKPRTVTATAQLAETGVDLSGRAVLSYDGFEVILRYAKNRTDESPCVMEGENGRLEIGGRISEPTSVKLVHKDGTEEDLTRPQGLVMSYESRAFIDLYNAGKTESPVNTFTKGLCTMEILDEIRRQTGVNYPADGKR